MHYPSRIGRTNAQADPPAPSRYFGSVAALPLALIRPQPPVFALRACAGGSNTTLPAHWFRNLAIPFPEALGLLDGVGTWGRIHHLPSGKV